MACDVLPVAMFFKAPVTANLSKHKLFKKRKLGLLSSLLDESAEELVELLKYQQQQTSGTVGLE